MLKFRLELKKPKIKRGYSLPTCTCIAHCCYLTLLARGPVPHFLEALGCSYLGWMGIKWHPRFVHIVHISALDDPSDHAHQAATGNNSEYFSGLEHPCIHVQLHLHDKEQALVVWPRTFSTTHLKYGLT